MRIENIFQLSINGIFHRKLRSWLTILGIVIGVAAVIALVSIGQGLQESVSSQLSQLGGNLIYVTPGRQRAGGGFGFGGGGGFGEGGLTAAVLKDNDVKLLRAVPGVQYASGVVTGRAVIQFNGQNASTIIQGVEPGTWELVQTVSLQSGRFLKAEDTSGVVIGSRIASSLFKKPVTLNSQLVVGGKIFRVVGELQSSGGFGGGVGDNTVIMTKDAARTVVNGVASTEVSEIYVKAGEGADPAAVSSLIENMLVQAHHVTLNTEDFTINSAQTIQQRISSVTGTITLFLGGIASISLLVGGIGVANTMFTSVMERTRHIGVLKSLGMTSGEVMKLFLIESALLGLIGGAIGTVLGYIVSDAISGISIGAGLPMGGAGRAGRGAMTYVSPGLVLFAIGFSVLVGVVSGLLPARSAAKLEPVEALRYE